MFEALLAYFQPLADIFISNTILVLLIAFGLITAIAVLSKRLNYTGRIVEIKEAPIGINNLLKDPIKRNILKNLKKDKKYLSRIAKEINLNPARARFHLKQLESFRLLASYKLTRESYYSLTDAGKWCLRALEKYYPETVFQKIKNKRMKLENKSRKNWLKTSLVQNVS